MPGPTKPKAPMALAQRAKILVGIGKARLGSRIPVACRHYQTLPAAITNYTYMKPIDYVGFDILVTVLCVTSTNWLYRIYF